MPATKTKAARQSNMATKVAATPAKAPAKRSKPEPAPVVVEVSSGERKRLQGHAIQELINGGGLTIAQMVTRLTATHPELQIDVHRVTDHVEYERDVRKRAAVDRKGVVTLVGKAPRWRKVG